MTLYIEMVSDLVCPWCWVGLRRMRAAIRQVPQTEVRLIFRPFELDPTVPAAGTEYKTYMKKAFASDEARERAGLMRQALIESGQSEGIMFNFEAIEKRPNSFDAHRLVHWAQGQALGLEAKEALFEAYFTKGQDIGDKEVLITLAARIGLDANIISDLLASDADTDQIHQQKKLFSDMGIRGVPTFIAHRQLAVQGAETAEKLARFLSTAAAQLPQQRGLDSANSDE